MQIFIGFLTFVMVMTSLFLILLVLVQLPKKEAGVGMAFGAGMSEMLLGAGSGNVLTRITKYTVGIYLGLALFLAIMISRQHHQEDLGVTRAIEEQARTAPPATTATPPLAPAFQALPTTSNLLMQPGTGTEVPPSPLSTTTSVAIPTTELPGPVVPDPASTTTPLLITPSTAVPAPPPSNPSPSPSPDGN